MDYYFIILTIVDAFVLGIMCVFTKCSEVLSKQQKRWFIGSFAIIIFISLLEVVTIVADNKPASYRWVSIIANYLGFGLTPAVPIFQAAALENNRSAKYALICEAVYLLFLAATLPLEIVFYVDVDNNYVRGDFFWIFVAAYIAAIVYLLAMTLRMATRYQNSSRNSIFLIFLFLFGSTLIQVFNPEIHVSWMCVSLLSILYFTYCNGMWQQLDKLTGLLNQKSYLNKTEALTKNGTLVVFDVDDFKLVNDNYGHPAGDQCLQIIADCIKKAYSKYGFCYRIGGDEFCVLLNEDADEDFCFRRFVMELERCRKNMDILPSVSVGTAPFSAGDYALNVKETADRNMYIFKKERKKANKRW